MRFIMRQLLSLRTNALPRCTTRSAIEDNRKIRFTMEPAHVRRI